MKNVQAAGLLICTLVILLHSYHIYSLYGKVISVRKENLKTLHLLSSVMDNVSSTIDSVSDLESRCLLKDVQYDIPIPHNNNQKEGIVTFSL